MVPRTIAVRRNDSPLIAFHALQGLQVSSHQLACRPEEFGSSSGVAVFRIDIWLRLFIEKGDLTVARHLLDQREACPQTGQTYRTKETLSRPSRLRKGGQLAQG